MIRHTIEPEGEQFRVKWHLKVGKLPWDTHNCGLFKSIEQAQQSLASVKPTKATRRKFPEAIASQPNALDMSDFHSCDTTHCRAGWAVHLAGKAGYDLERRTSPVFAAMQIYEASGYKIAPPRFFETNEQAMSDMKRLADEDAARNALRQEGA